MPENVSAITRIHDDESARYIKTKLTFREPIVWDGGIYVSLDVSTVAAPDNKACEGETAVFGPIGTGILNGMQERHSADEAITAHFDMVGKLQ